VGRSIWSVISPISARWHSSASQAAWIGYAAAISGKWGLCADSTGKPIGERLYVQYNLFRHLLSLPDVQSPVDESEFCECTTVALSYEHHTASGDELILIEGGGATSDTFIVLQQKRGLLNSSVIIPVGNDNLLSPGDPDFNEVKAFILENVPAPIEGTVNAEWKCCFSTINGAPGLPGMTDLQWTELP
jgi:hypothetical protein